MEAKAPELSVLIVDDDRSLALTLQAILKKAGYECRWVSTGAEAMALAGAQAYAAVLIDVRLPDTNGLEVLRAVKRTSPDAGAIMMTGYADMETAVAALNEGAFAYITKPYNVDEVKAALGRIVEKRRLLRDNRELLMRLLTLNAELETKVAQRTKDLQSANLRLADTIEKLREADAAKSRFVSMVSHELRTPLTGIIGFTETLMHRLEMLGKEKVQHYLGIIHTESLRLSRLIESVLDLSRIEEKRLDLLYEAFDLEAVARSAVDGLRLIKSQMRFEVDFDPEARAVVSDRDRVQQIFVNLLGNAIKYSPDGTSIRITAKADPGGVLVSVADSGPGIPDDQLDKIFEAFYRTADAINMKSPGTGLGLTITRALVEALGGRIEVASVLGKGSVFSFYLPKEPAHAAVQTPS